ncbi:OmpH family outer membrane protein [Bdellovibrio sp. HCB337]|uniref:OmpH family outer membrane protein n=1 Tax=Bdellovibrio sp. HCB337 TaxID=3394358 RepID=UPI0039A4C854
MKRVLIVFVTSWVMAAAVAHAESRIGVVNMEKILANLPKMKKVKAELEEDFNKKKKELEKSENDLQVLEKEIEKKKAVLSEEALKQKQQEFQGQVVQFREKVTKSQMEMQKKQNEKMVPILEEVKKAIAKVAAERGFTLVLNQEPHLLFIGKETDFTDDVLKVM